MCTYVIKQLLEEQKLILNFLLTGHRQFCWLPWQMGGKRENQKMVFSPDSTCNGLQIP